jgi:hypothetical protein
MSISAMKEALEALEKVVKWHSVRDKNDLPLKPINQPPEIKESIDASAALRQAIAEVEKQEPVGYVSESGKGAYFLVGIDLEDDTPLYTAPVHASDISQERADETAKYRHEWVGQPDLARVGEVGVWGKEKNT